MIKIILSFVIFIIAIYCYNEKIHIDFKSFFKKGFYKRNDNFGLYCFVAEQGGGKTYSIVDSLEKVGKNKIILSNVESYCKHHKNAIYMPNFGDIVDKLEQLEDCSEYVIFFDEIFSVLETNGKLNKRYRNFLTQFRKRRIHCFTTCQLWGDLPLNFRRLTRYEIDCHMFNLGFFAILVNRINDGYNTKFDKDLQEYVSPRIKTNIKKCSKAIADGYDTYETIDNSNISLQTDTRSKPSHYKQLNVVSQGTGIKIPVNHPGNAPGRGALPGKERG